MNLKFIEKYKAKIQFTNINKNIIFVLLILKTLEHYNNLIIILEDNIKDFIDTININLKQYKNIDIIKDFEIDKLNNKKLFELYEALEEIDFENEYSYYLSYYVFNSLNTTGLNNDKHMTPPDLVEGIYKLLQIDENKKNRVADITAGIGITFIPFVKNNKNIEIISQEIDMNLVNIQILNMYYVNLLKELKER